MEATCFLDLFLFAGSSFAIWALQSSQHKKKTDFLVVDQNNNRPLSIQTDEEFAWYRSTFVLVMHEPPHLFYEPKEWSHTTVLLLQEEQDHPEGNTLLRLPGGKVKSGQTYETSAIIWLKNHHKIDVCKPENCLHHLFTFPVPFENKRPDGFAGCWGDFYECVARGPIPDYEDDDENHIPLVCFSLAELKQMCDHDDAKNRFSEDTLYALKLYFQRQNDLRAKRRLLKG